MNKKQTKQEIEKNKNNSQVIIKQNKGIVMKNAKMKYFAIFLLEVNESYSFVKIKRINPIKRKVRYAKDKLFILSPEYPTYINGLKTYYFFDLEHGQLLLNKTANSDIINSEIIDSVVSKSIVSQLTSNLGNQKLAFQIMQLLIGGVFGGIIGYMIGGG